MIRKVIQCSLTWYRLFIWQMCERHTLSSFLTGCGSIIKIKQRDFHVFYAATGARDGLPCIVVNQALEKHKICCEKYNYLRFVLPPCDLYYVANIIVRSCDVLYLK